MEIDSMDPIPTTGSEVNFETGSVRRYFSNSPVTGQSTLGLSIDLRGNDNAYENGRMEITNVGTFNVLRSVDTFYNDDVILSATPGTNVIGNGFKIYDDDDRFLSTIGLAPALPKDNESTNIIQVIRPVFLPAYIEVTNANAEGFNTTKRIAFKRNAYMESVFGVGTGAGVYDDAKDLHDSQNFWAHTVTFGYQPDPTDDFDPKTEGPLLGVTLKKSVVLEGGVSGVFVETIRDVAIDGLVAGNNLSQFYPEYRKTYTNWLSGVFAHEIGHAPGNQSEGADHDEDGLMNKGGQELRFLNGQPLLLFTPKTIKRFRSATSWSN